jgi:gamma-glutamyltranspeptidase/glutathione hydrolase
LKGEKTWDQDSTVVNTDDFSPTNRADAAGEAGRPTIRGTRHACVAGHYLSAHAGFAILEAGGNAVDAGVAAGITEGVVQSEQVNVAGIAPCMIYLADTREVVTIAGVGSWPLAASCAELERGHQGRIPRGLLRHRRARGAGGMGGGPATLRNDVVRRGG